MGKDAKPPIPVRFEGLPEPLARKLEYYEEHYFTFDLPVPLDCGLKLYPIKVKDYTDFMSCMACLMLNKNESVDTFRMTHLEFLISKLKSNNEESAAWSYRLSKLLEMVFRIQNGYICPECGKYYSFSEYFKRKNDSNDQCECGHPTVDDFIPVISYENDPDTMVEGRPDKVKPMLVINGEFYIKSKDFDDLRKIILFQNLHDYRDEDHVAPEIRQDQAEKRRLESLKNGNIGASLEKKMVCVATKTAFSFSDIYEMSIRKFNMLLFTVDDAMNYEITRLAQLTGLVQFKTAPEHWIYKPAEVDIYGKYKSVDDMNAEFNSNGIGAQIKI